MWIHFMCFSVFWVRSYIQCRYSRNVWLIKMGRRRQSERVSWVVQRFYASRDLELCTWTPLVCTELHSAHTKRVFMECQQYLRARACANKYSILNSLLDVNSARHQNFRQDRWISRNIFLWFIALKCFFRSHRYYDLSRCSVW